MARLSTLVLHIREIVVNVTVILCALMAFSWMVVGTALFLGMVL